MQSLFNTIHILIILLFSISFTANAQPAIESNVKITGAMRNVMRLGQLQGTIDLDTISQKIHLYGIGPLEYLTGEMMIYDGKSYISKVNSDGSILVEESWKAKAPFFVYANNEKWSEQIIPDSITNLLQLESFLDATTVNSNRPFVFKLSGTIETATVHIVNLPQGKKVSSPEEAHEGLKHFTLKNESCDLVGFFSTEHQAVFTHHDTFIHVHLINRSRNKMGHLENVEFKKGAVKLFLPL